MGTLEPKIERMLAKKDIKGLIKALKDESYDEYHKDSIFFSAYGALIAIANELPLSNSDISEITEAIAYRYAYYYEKTFHVPHWGKKNWKKELNRFEAFLNSVEPFRNGKLPINFLEDHFFEAFVDYVLKQE